LQCQSRRDEHPAMQWNSGVLFRTASARVKGPRSVSQDLDTARLIFDTPGLVGCDSSCLSPRASGVLRMVSRLALDQPRQEE
jgi:hypothetical protein